MGTHSGEEELEKGVRAGPRPGEDPPPDLTLHPCGEATSCWGHRCGSETERARIPHELVHPAPWPRPPREMGRGHKGTLVTAFGDRGCHPSGETVGTGGPECKTGDTYLSPGTQPPPCQHTAQTDSVMSGPATYLPEAGAGAVSSLQPRGHTRTRTTPERNRASGGVNRDNEAEAGAQHGCSAPRPGWGRVHPAAREGARGRRRWATTWAAG